MRRKWKFESGDFDFETAERIRQRIQNIAQSKRITIKELSVRTGYSDPYLSRLLSGQRRLSSDHLKKLSLALETPIAVFKKQRNPRQHDELFYDERLTPLENWKMAGMLHEIKDGLINYFIKKRRKKSKKGEE
jgi:transcriptional regulator with XRE-family HTH domain